MERSIRPDAANLELRFLRFTIQTNSPSFLGYNDQIDLDRQFILKNVPRISDDGLKKMIINFMTNSK